MPRTKAQANRESALVRLIKGYFGAHNAAVKRKEDMWEWEKVAADIGMSPTTLNRRLKHPETFKTGEVERLGRRLHIPIDLLRVATIKY